MFFGHKIIKLIHFLNAGRSISIYSKTTSFLIVKIYNVKKSFYKIRKQKNQKTFLFN